VTRGRGRVGWIALSAALVVGIVWFAARVGRAPSVPAPVASRHGGSPPSPAARSTAAPSAPPARMQDAEPVPRTPASPSSAEHAFDVHVVDRGGRAIAGARIHLREGAETLDFVSDASGRSTIAPKEPPGAFVRMQVEADGFCRSQPVFKSEPTIEVVLSKAVHLSGRVLDETTRAPIAGARVQQGSGYPDADASPVVVTGTDGAFDLPEMPSGGGAPIVVRAIGGPADVKIVKLEEKNETPTYDFLLARGKEIRGRIVDWTSGEPVPDATIVDAKRQLDVAPVGPDGRFVVRLIPQIAIDVPEIAVRAPGHCRMSRRVERSEEEPVDLGDVRIPRSVALEGTVRDAAGVPIAGANLQAGIDVLALVRADANAQRAFEESTKALGRWRFEDLDDVHGGRVRTDAEGKFRVDSLSEWMQRYWVRSLPSERHVIELHGEGHEPAGGTIRVDIVAKSSAGSRLVGRLLLNGKPSDGRVQWRSGERFGELFVGGDGRFVIDPLPEGRWKLKTERGPEISGSLSKDFDLEVKPGDSIERDFDLQVSVAHTSGRVLTTHGAPVKGFQLVFFADRSHFESSARTDADGAWAIDLPVENGECRVRVLSQAEDRWEHVRPGASGIEWKLTAIVPVHVRAIDKATRARVARPKFGWRKSGDERFLEPEESNDGSGFFPTNDGWYTFGVPEGSMDLQVTAVDQGYPATRVLGVRAAPDEKEPRVEFELEHGWTVGFHLAPDQPPIPDGSLCCFLLTPEEYDAAQGRAANRELDGEDVIATLEPFLVRAGKTIRIPGVRPGRYRLLSIGPFHLDSPDTIDLVADGTDVEVRWKR
jgi:hypothetical protein